MLAWTVADEIRKLRAIARLDQEQLAAVLGVSRQTISKWERGLSEPTVSQYRKIEWVASESNREPADFDLAEVA